MNIKTLSDQRKNEILLDANKQLQEENERLKAEIAKLRRQSEDNISKVTRQFKKEQQKAIRELTALKKKYQKELDTIRRDKRNCEKIIQQKFGLK